MAALIRRAFVKMRRSVFGKSSVTYISIPKAMMEQLEWETGSIMLLTWDTGAQPPTLSITLERPPDAV